MRVCKEHGHVVLKWQCCKKNQGPVPKYWMGYLKEEEFKIFLNCNGLTGGLLLHTEFNCDEFNAMVIPSVVDRNGLRQKLMENFSRCDV